MSRLTIIGVIVLMSISLLGVVGLQLYWISDAIRVKQEQFDRSVHEALAKVVEKLETQEAVSAVASGMATLQQAPAESSQEPTLASTTPPVSTPQARIQVKPAVINKAQGTTQESAPAASETRATQPKATTIYGQASRPAHGRQNLSLHLTPGDSLLPAGASGARTTLRGQQALSPDYRQRMATTQPIPADSLKARALRISGGNTVRVRHIYDSTASFTHTVNGRSYRVSVDTLQYIALHMDSILRSGMLSKTIRPAEIASINVRKDTIVFLKRPSSSRQLQVQHEISSNGNVIFRNVVPLQEGKPLAEGLHGTQYIVRSQQPMVQTKAISTTPQPARQTAAVATTTPDPVKVEAKKEKLNNVVEKMVVEFVSKDVPLEKRLNLVNLRSLLQSELHSRGISLDFGYWVLSGQQDTVASAHIKTAATDNFSTYKANLFPNDIFDKPDYLAVYFPDSQAYALRSLWVMLLFSAVFTLIIVATFGTTIHIIFRQKKLSDMKNDFINNMTHEFKTPIATISLATDSIANPRVYSNPDKIKYYTDIIRQENKRMNVQVENVLQIAQLEKNDYRMNLQPVDLHALITKAVDSIRLQVEERLGQITAQLNALEHELKLDEVHAYNVICNLLDNANKYSPSSPEIRLVTQNVEGGIVLAVEDKGMGMSRDTQLRVFDKFYRVPTGNLHNVKGFGLGLSYVKAIVKAHHGSIRLQSEPGKGSRFEIYLPFNG